MSFKIKSIQKLITERILVLDGALGTRFQSFKLEEGDFRGSLFQNLSANLMGVYDVLNLTRPDYVEEIHRAYLEAGADVIETNTFNATSISLEDYGLGDFAYDINFQAARIARKAADSYSVSNPLKPRFVAGSVGPTNKMCSVLPASFKSQIKSISYKELVLAYSEQMKALLLGGVDVFLIETIFDLLNARAAVEAAEETMSALGKKIPIMLSATLSQTGRMGSGESLDAFLNLAREHNVFSVGLNCCYGVHSMKPFLRELSEKATPFYVSAYPNAGFPDDLGRYGQTAEELALEVKDFLDENLVNIIGGCCGTTEDYILQLQHLVEGKSPRKVVSSHY